MSFFGWLVGIGVIGYLGKTEKKAREKREEIERAFQVAEREAREAREKEARRINSQCKFLDGISEDEFKSIAIHSGKGIKRLSEVSVEGPIVYGTVQSQSGISEWYFKIDFNDFGHVTGRYWLSTDNYDSNIPDRLAETISSAIINYDTNDNSSDNQSRASGENDTSSGSYREWNCARNDSRTSTPYAPCSFSDGISKYDFQQIVKKAVKKSDRIEELKIFDAKIYGLIRSQTGKTAWRFVLDFNDNGHLTGYYRNLTKNEDSQISIYIGESIKQEILHRLISTGVN